MQNNKFTEFNPLLAIANELIKNTSSKLEKDFLRTFCCSPLLGQQKFPVSDTYAFYKENEDKQLTDEIEKISLKIYLAGYRKEDIEVSEDPSNNTVVVSGEINNNQHFPKGDNVKRYTQGASSKKFTARYSMIPKFKLSSANMIDGVLSLEFDPVAEYQVKKIKID